MEIKVGPSVDFKDGDCRVVQSGRTEIGVFKWAGEFFAYSNICLHQGGPACEGLLMHNVEEVIGKDQQSKGGKFSKDAMNFVCPWHGYEYDLRTGELVADRKRKLKKYAVVEKGNDLYVIA